MIQSVSRRPRPLARLGRDESGVALIEFAYGLPLVLALGFAGLETANLAAAHLKVSQIGMMVADNAGRIPSGIDEGDIYEVFAGASQIGTSLNFDAHGRIVLSSLQDNKLASPKNGQMVNWQRCMGALTTIKSSYAIEGKGKTDASLTGMGKTGNRIQSLPGTAVMFVEITYDYQPLLSGVIPGRRIRYESAFNVRERVNQDITNTKSLAVKSC